MSSFSFIACETHENIAHNSRRLSATVVRTYATQPFFSWTKHINSQHLSFHARPFSFGGFTFSGGAGGAVHVPI